MTNGGYQGVILAAGAGSRMGTFGECIPKPIMPICNKPLLVYQLEHMREAGIDEVFIVIGHLGHRVAHVIGDGSEFGLRVVYVEQQERLGLAHALSQVEPHVQRPFLLMLGDIFFDVPDLRRMFKHMEDHHAAAVLAVRGETDPAAVQRNFAVFVGEDGRVRRVIEKPRHVTTMLKGCGLYLFDLAIFDAIRRTPRTALRDEYELTDAIQVLIDYERHVQAAPIVEWDVNVTYAQDLIECSVYELRRRGKRFLIGDACSLAEGVELVDTVLGDRVRVEQPVVLTRCVVMSDAVVNSMWGLTDKVVGPEPSAGVSTGAGCL